MAEIIRQEAENKRTHLKHKKTELKRTEELMIEVLDDLAYEVEHGLKR